MADGDFSPFDVAARADALKKPLAAWYRILFLVPLFEVFDSKLGYPGEGPRPRRMRDHYVDLEAAQLTPAVARRRAFGTAQF